MLIFHQVFRSAALLLTVLVGAACVNPEALESTISTQPPIFVFQVPEREEAIASTDTRPTATPFATPTPFGSGKEQTGSLTRTRIMLGLVPVGPVIPTPTPTPLPTPDGTHRQVAVPILMYHYIESAPANADAIRRDLSVSPELFAAHLDVIQRHGYETVSLRDVVNHLALGTPLPAKPIVLTFDDGYTNHFTNAVPLLTERGMTGTFFVISEFPHRDSSEYMNWDQIRQMVRAGMEIESHARLHESLAGRSDYYLREQARGSVLTFEHELGYTPRFIAYPMGFYDQRAIDIFQAEGFWAGLTTQNGVRQDNQDLFRMRRIRINATMNANELDWLLSDQGRAWLLQL